MSAHPGHSRGKALAVSVLNLFGKCLAIAKTMMIAAMFGASATLDAFWVAYSLPVMLPAILTSVVTVAFVPRFMASLEGRSGPEAWRGANTLFTVILLLSLVSAALCYVFTDALVRALAPGLAPDTHAQAVRLSRWLLPCVPLLTLSALLSALSFARERFWLPSLDGVVSNVLVIASAALLSARLGVGALTLGVLAGFLVQAGLLIWGNRDDLRASLRPAWAPRHRDFVEPLKHLFPLLIGTLGAMAVNLVGQFFLSRLDAGSISALNYASMIAFLPIEVFAQAVITAYYPAMGRCFARNDVDGLARVYADGARFVMLLTMGAAVLLALLAEPIVIVLLERGRFDATASATTASVLFVLTLGLAFRGLAYFNYRVLHAALRPWLQVSIGLLGVATQIGLNLWWVDSLGIRGIALSLSLATLQSALLSSLAVQMLLGRGAWRTFLGDLGRVILMALALWACARGLSHLLQGFSAEWPRLAIALATMAVCGLATVVAVGVGLWLRQPDLLSLWRGARERLSRVARRGAEGA